MYSKNITYNSMILCQSQQQVYRKMAEKEKDALKDEIRRLQVSAV